MEEDETQITEKPGAWKIRSQKAKNAQKIESVQFIPLTENSELKKRLNEMDLSAKFSSRFRYVEVAGTSLINSLGTPNPWDTPCHRDKCFPCQAEVGKCMAQGANYTITCMICKDNGVQVKYFGETARTPYDRGHEHLSELGAKNSDSPLSEHMSEEHV